MKLEQRTLQEELADNTTSPARQAVLKEAVRQLEKVSLYLVANSVGGFRTTDLKGGSTVWTPSTS